MDAFISIPLVAVNNTAALVTPVVKNTRLFEGIRALTAGELVQWPTALSVVEILDRKQNSTRVDLFFSTATVAANQASANAVIPGSVTSGQATLVAGTLAITIPGLTTANKGFVTLVSSNTGSSTVTYQAVCTANTLTLRANVAAGTINVADISTLNYFVL